MYVQPSSWPKWVAVAFVAAIVGLGIWAFGVDSPPRVVQVEIGLRNLDDQRAELGIRETDHEGVVHFYEATGAVLDYSLTNRPRSIYTDPIRLSNDRENAPSQVRITLRGESDEDVKLGLRTMKQNRRWTSTRFPRTEPIQESEWQREEWVYLSPMAVNVVYHQIAVEGVRLFVYIMIAFGVLFAVAMFVWKRWMS